MFFFVLERSKCGRERDTMVIKFVESKSEREDTAVSPSPSSFFCREGEGKRWREVGCVYVIESLLTTALSLPC